MSKRFERGFVATLLLALAASVSHATSVTEVADWTSSTATTATATLGGITINAETTSDAEFLGFAGNHFATFDGECGSWEGMFGLDHTVQGLITSNVNGGDYQEFTFSSPLADGLFFIENFDSDSMAMITATGATSIKMIDMSPSIVFEAVGPNMANLSTTNSGFNGEGDAAFLIEGDVTSIRVDYKAGEGANGIFYNFANGTPTEKPQPIPEPTSILVMAGLFGFGGLLAVYRRRKQ